MQIAIAIPSKNKSNPAAMKIQPRNSGGNSSSGLGVPCRETKTKIPPIVA